VPVLPGARQAEAYEPSCPHSLVKDVIPLVEEHDRVIANKDNRASA